MTQVNLHNRNRLTGIENRFMVTKGKRGGGEISQDQQTQITVYNIDKKQGSTIEHKELYSIFYNKP